MNICIPVTEEKGLESPVSQHFGSAPLFAMIDPDTRTCRFIGNRNKDHVHGQCQPLAALAGEKVDGVIVGGIGAGALSKLAAAGIRVWKSPGGTLVQVLDAYTAGILPEASPHTACQGHHHGPVIDLGDLGTPGSPAPGHGHGHCHHGSQERKG